MAKMDLEDADAKMRYLIGELRSMHEKLNNQDKEHYTKEVDKLTDELARCKIGDGWQEEITPIINRLYSIKREMELRSIK